MTPDQYCQQKTAQSGSSFYYSFLFLPTEKRRAITALYAFCREVDDVVDECTDPGIARSKLDWWREEVDKLYTGKATHPVTQALTTSLENFDLHKEYLDEILDGMQMDLDITRYDDFNDLLLYCHRAAGVVGLLAVEIFGYRDRDTLKFAENLGIAFQLTNIIRDIKEDTMHGRIYLPLQELDSFRVKPGDLQLPETTDAVRRLVQFEVKRAHEYYNKALAHLPAGDQFSQRSSLIMSNIYRTLLTEIENDGFQVMEHRVKLTPLRKLWIAWKTYRKIKKPDHVK
ncbi:MAG TPA: squalene synthase HpnD [Gammaproteobacteria bacterium]|nr:squalene synthase HpnD [Gammaproteobacteria bacterium]